MRKLLSNVDKPLLISTLIMFLFGLIMIQSASAIEMYMRYGSSIYMNFIKQALFILLGIITFFIIIKIPTKKYYVYARIFLFAVIISLLLLRSYGTITNSTISWFKFGFFSIQPSELLKIAIIMYMAVYYEKNINNLNNQLTLILPLIFSIISFGLVFVQPDLGTSLIIAALTAIIFYSVPMEKHQRSLINKILAGGIILVLTIVLATGGSLLSNYQQDRLNFLNPCQRYQEKTGYQVCNGFIAFNNGGLLPQGIGKSTQKYMYLPYSYTDFIFPVIVEELGLITGIVIIIIYIFILYRILLISKKSTTLRGAILTFGVAIFIFLHVAINLIGVLGLGPITGVPLPFLSYGGSFGLSLMIGLAIVQRVCIENNINLKK